MIHPLALDLTGDDAQGEASPGRGTSQQIPVPQVGCQHQHPPALANQSFHAAEALITHQLSGLVRVHAGRLEQLHRAGGQVPVHPACQRSSSGALEPQCLLEITKNNTTTDPLMSTATWLPWQHNFQAR